MRRLIEAWLILGMGALALGAEPLSDGMAIPKMTLKSHLGKPVSLGDHAKDQKKRNLLLVFFRTGTCNVCLSQLKDVAQNLEVIAAQNTAVLGISLDDAIVHARTAETIQDRFPLLLDPEAKTVKAFGIFNPEDNLSRPSLYLVGPDKKILYHYVGKNLTDRPPFNEVLEVVRHYSAGVPIKK